MKPIETVTLIQRASRCKKPRKHAQGLDREFSWDYMGSSEFEFGTLPYTIRLMRAEESIALNEIRHLQHAVYFVGRPDELSLARDVFADQLLPRNARKMRTKERTEIADAYGAYGLGDLRFRDECHTTIWIAVQSKLGRKAWTPFALFKHWHDAEKFLELRKNPDA